MIDPKFLKRNYVLLRKNLIETEDSLWGTDRATFEYTMFDVEEIKNEQMFSNQRNGLVLYQNMFIV